MSSDEESLNNAPEISDNEQNNEILEIGEDLQGQEEQTEEVQRDEEAEEERGEDGERKTVKPKRVIRNPQPKLNAETLKGPRGIAALENYFQRVKFNGKGKEPQDLEVIMKTYEYWCHRLFPKFPFDTCIERLEKLGSKKAVQTHIKRIRFDLLLEDKPILDDSDDEPNVEGFVDIENDEINQQQNQQFDELLGFSAASVITPVELTEEQLERIRLNKERAELLKRERLKKIKDKAGESLQVSSQVPGTSGLGSELGLEPSQAVESTQSDIFDQELTSGIQTEKSTQGSFDKTEDRDASFDHESSVKGKTIVKGSRIKKKSNKKIIIFDNDSEKSNNENIEDNIQNKDVSRKRVSDEELDIDENSFDLGIGQKKKSKQNIANNEGGDESNKKHRDLSRSESPTSINGDDNLDDAQSVNHGSCLKGKKVVQGARIKNVSNRKIIAFTYNSEESQEESNVGNIEDTNQNISTTSKGVSNELLDIEHNYLNGNLKQKRKSKRNIIEDSDDDQGSGEDNIKLKELSRSKRPKYLIDDDSDEENPVGRNISQKKFNKLSTILDTDESDQEGEDIGQSLREINRKEPNDLDESNKMDTDQAQLCNINKANSSNIHGVNEDPLELDLVGHKSKSSQISFLSNIDADNTVTVDKAAESYEQFKNNKEQLCDINNGLSSINEKSSDIHISHKSNGLSQLPSSASNNMEV